MQEPAVYFGQFMDTLHAIALFQGFGDNENTLVGGFRQSFVNVVDFQRLVFHEAVHALPDHSQAFLDGFLKRAANGHHLAYRLHRRTDFATHTVELTKVPTGDFHYYIVQSRLKERRCFLCNRILQVKQSVSETEFGSDKCQRISGGF